MPEVKGAKATDPVDEDAASENSESNIIMYLRYPREKHHEKLKQNNHEQEKREPKIQCSRDITGFHAGQ